MVHLKAGPQLQTKPQILNQYDEYRVWFGLLSLNHDNNHNHNNIMIIKNIIIVNNCQIYDIIICYIIIIVIVIIITKI